MKNNEKLKKWQPCQGYCQMTGAASAFLSITDSKVIMNCPRWCAVLAERELATAVKEYEERLFVQKFWNQILCMVSVINYSWL